MRPEVSGAIQRRRIAALLASTFIATQAPTTFAAPQSAAPPPQTQGQPAAPGPSDEERAAARVAATEAVQLLDAGKYAEALDRLRRAEALVHAPTHLLYIARAQAKLRQLVEASETYLKIVHETLAPDAPRPFVEAQTAAEQEVKELDARIPRLLIRVQGPGAADAAVSMDSVAVPAAMVGLSAPVDPGVHVVRATAKDGTTAETRVKLVPGAQETALLTLHAPTASAAAAPGALPPPPGDVPPPGESSSQGSGGRTALGIAVMGLGVAGVAVGTAFVFVNRSKRTDANELCPKGQCPVSDKLLIQSLDDQANSAQTVAWVGYGAGVAALATGVVILLTAPHAKSSDAARAASAERALRPWVGVGWVGLTGAF